MLFKEMIKITNQAPVLELVQLRSMHTKAAKKLLTGAPEPAKARKLLDERYGEKQFAVISAMHKLHSVKLAHWPAHYKIESLVLATKLSNCV